MCIPKLKYHFGPTVLLESKIYGATESVIIGVGYDVANTNLYRLDEHVHFELLDVDKEYHIDNVSQLWEVEVGMCTNSDGLWRHALEDIVEIAGFSPKDGHPLVRYIGRKGVGFRLWGEFISSDTLQSAVQAAEGVLGHVSQCTVIPDERQSVRAYGFLLELDGSTELDSTCGASARAKIHDHLSINTGYKQYSKEGVIGHPTITILAPETFASYRERRVAASGSTAGQTKVPCTITDLETIKWLLTRVVKEL